MPTMRKVNDARAKKGDHNISTPMAIRILFKRYHKYVLIKV